MSTHTSLRRPYVSSKLNSSYFASLKSIDELDVTIRCPYIAHRGNQPSTFSLLVFKQKLFLKDRPHLDEQGNCNSVKLYFKITN